MKTINAIRLWTLSFMTGIVIVMAATAVMVTLSSKTVAHTPYCQGWRQGYINGYCYQDPFCAKPLIPLCPLPSPLFDSKQDGLNDGFIAGQKKRRDENSTGY